MDFEERFAAAQNRVKAKLGLYKHMASFAAGNGLLVGVDLLTTPGLLWFYWPFLGWSLVLGIHAQRALKTKA